MRRESLLLWGALAIVSACDDRSNPAVCVGSRCDEGVADASASLDAGADGDTPDEGPTLDAQRPDAAPEDADRPDQAMDAEPDAADAEAPDEGPTPDLGPDADPSDVGVGEDAEVEVDAEMDAEVDAEMDAEVDAEMDAEIDAMPMIDPCPPGQVAEPEICNDFDDDCDGEIDEGFDVGGPCGELGYCGPGFLECGDEGHVRCSSEPGASADQSTPERCNGRDDDCDGEVDEQPETLAVACYSGPADTRAVGACADGLRACADGRFQACAGDVRPSMERCNGVDDDCDGEVDEGYVPTELCGQGVCRAASTPSACVDGVEVPCVPGPALGDDRNCDGFDDDCDGQIDEGFEPVGQCGVGRCGDEAIPSRCLNGVELPCQPAIAAPVDLFCDGVDDDCNGQEDEDYSPTAQCGLGVCRTTSTSSSCTDGVEQACQPGAPTGDDSDCNGLDDDCDGRVDEDYVVIAQCGVGVCAESPRPSRCVNGLEFPCQPGARALDDAICDGRDDDCDGLVDEDYVVVRRCGEGVCAGSATPSSCVAGVETACVPGVPAVEVDDTCDRQDDDCDGVVDDDVPVFGGDALRLTDHQGGAIEPRIAAAGGAAGGFGVAWADNREGARGIYFARVGRDGVRVGDDVRLAAQPGLIRKPDITPWGEGFAAVWHTTAAGPSQIFFARVDAGGNVVQEATRVLESASDAVDARVVYNGAEFATVWTDARHGDTEIYLRRLTAAGQPIGNPTRVTDLAGAASVPAIAPLAIGQGYMVVYNEAVGGAFSIWAQRIDVNGRPLGGRFEISDDVGNSNAPVIVPRADGGFGVAWYDTRDGNTEIYATHITIQGVRDGDLQRISEDLRASTLAAITAADRGFAVAWMDTRTGDTEVWVRRADANAAAVGAEQQVSNDPSTSFSPTIAFDGEVFGVVWYDGRHGESEIYFRHGRLGCAP